MGEVSIPERRILLLKLFRVAGSWLKKKKSRLTFSKFYYSFKILHLKCTLLACTGQLTPTTPPLAVLLTSPSWVSDSEASALALFLAAFQRDLVLTYNIWKSLGICFYVKRRKVILE